MRGATVAVTALLVLLGSGVTSCNATPSPPSSHLSDDARSPAMSVSSRAAGTRERPLAACRVEHAQMTVVSTGATMSQPFADIEITDTGRRPCLLKGYPRITAWGHEGWGSAARSVRLDVVVHHGIYERTDSDPRPVIVSQQRPAFFSVGTATAYQGGLHVIIIDRISVTLSGTGAPHQVPIDLVATRPRGDKIPVGVTAVRSAPRQR